MTQSPEEVARGLTKAQRECLLDLYLSGRPFRMGDAAEFKDHSDRLKLYELKLLNAVFPEATSGNSGRQFWEFNDLGARVAALIKEE